MKEETQFYYWDKFYDNNIKPQLEEKGEAYIEWLISKNSLVKQINYLRLKYKLEIVHFPKEANPDWTCIFVKRNDQKPNMKEGDKEQQMPIVTIQVPTGIISTQCTYPDCPSCHGTGRIPIISPTDGRKLSAICYGSVMGQVEEEL